MPGYDSASFRPPAPVALVTVHVPGTGNEVANVPMLLDSGADVSLIPQRAIAGLHPAAAKPATYELEAFDGTISQAAAVDLELRFVGKSFRGQFLLMDGDHGILGRNILNNLALLFDGPALAWREQR